jgi:hypothetical protein
MCADRRVIQIVYYALDDSLHLQTAYPGLHILVEVFEKSPGESGVGYEQEDREVGNSWNTFANRCDRSRARHVALAFVRCSVRLVSST